MATYLETWNLLGDTELQARISVALSKSAYNVLAEDPLTINHAARLKWAQSVLNDPLPSARIAIFGVVSDVKGSKGISDIDLQAVTDKLVDTLSNQFA